LINLHLQITLDQKVNWYRKKTDYLMKKIIKNNSWLWMCLLANNKEKVSEKCKQLLKKTILYKIRIIIKLIDHIITIEKI
jgi:hypothetical protein